jgi:L-ascorbate metabolism protein UlaG (beta-lactamase superfamily)
MKNYGIKINYLFNSGFTVETEKHLLVFDYFKDSVDSGEKNRANGAIGDEDLNIDKEIIVFSSHSHHDHFNPVILDWKNTRPDITYVLSSDIKDVRKTENINVISAYEELKLEDVYVKAYGSTDIGISFLVKVDGTTLFHSGDLNWWYWWDDTEGEIQQAERWFKDEIRKIKEEAVDIAFFPVDPRLEHNYCVGGEYFIKEINPQVFIPMHFGETYQITENFADRMNASNSRVITINHRGQEILL